MPSFLNRLESPEGLRTLSTACYIGAAVPLALFFLMGHEWYPWHIRFPLISMLGAALLGFIVLRFLGKAAATYPAAEVTGERRRALLAPIACGLFVGLA
ncbi:MAG TPA: hypothetical protein VD967_00510, partial [Candidatus Paceibacterota bacterium]|nr:hypothetical protein [Candidatus Paceibacterota bacterium]